ncbi:MAG: IS66 family transposase zinc-finger binding domain-containing protein [Nitrospirae bacterium]|uniref:IS66 family transposase zinc-finger binding domain-containing protein n=1 Tax=Candidatus Magnetominusculus dajiuhuensis TaxID=3137712 RepID=UPI0019E8A530|nr:IS66 family transposase zinc-finger binding domain-containing protein [Nitrospirota bacterium]
MPHFSFCWRHWTDDISGGVEYSSVSGWGQLCACESHLSHIGQEVSEKLDIVPAKMHVIRHGFSIRV